MMPALFLALMVVCLSFLCSSASGAEWVYFGSDTQGSDFFYDQESLDFPTRDITRVWKKRIFSEEAKKEMIAERVEAKLSTDGYEELAYSLIREDIDCRTRKSNILSISYCTKTGNIIAKGTVPSIIRSWEGVRPGTIGDLLRRAVCKTGNRSK